jgi:hypothetical protein
MHLLACVHIQHLQVHSFEAYLKEFDAAKRRMQQELGKNYTAETDHRIKLTTIRSMVDRRVLTQLANDSHYATTQRELQMSIEVPVRYSLTPNKANGIVIRPTIK